METAVRIIQLRKQKGISQEDLAAAAGVSRQAVSKWESGQSMPDADKIILMSDYFGVTTDYILKGTEPVQDPQKENRKTAGRILYIAAVTLVFCGLFCAFGTWYEQQRAVTVWASLMIQASGIALYFTAGAISREKAGYYINVLLAAGLLFIPVSAVSGYLSLLIFRQGWIAPYPSGIMQTALFFLLYLSVCAAAAVMLRKH